MNFERVKVNFGVLEKSIRSLEKSWKSPGKLFLKKGTNPDLCMKIKKLLKEYTVGSYSDLLLFYFLTFFPF